MKYKVKLWNKRNVKVLKLYFLLMYETSINDLWKRLKIGYNYFKRIAKDENFFILFTMLVTEIKQILFSSFIIYYIQLFSTAFQSPSVRISEYVMYIMLRNNFIYSYDSIFIHRSWERQVNKYFVWSYINFLSL